MIEFMKSDEKIGLIIKQILNTDNGIQNPPKLFLQHTEKNKNKIPKTNL